MNTREKSTGNAHAEMLPEDVRQTVQALIDHANATMPKAAELGMAEDVPHMTNGVQYPLLVTATVETRHGVIVQVTESAGNKQQLNAIRRRIRAHARFAAYRI